MKQKIPPAAFAVAIVVFLLVACFIGYRAMNPSDSGAPSHPASMTPDQQARYNSSHSSGGQGSGSSNARYQQYQKMMQQHQNH